MVEVLLVSDTRSLLYSFSILLSSGSTVHNIVTKHIPPPITFDTGSAINTPEVPIFRAYGIIYVSGTTINTFLRSEKNIACFFLLSYLNTVCPIYCKSININAAKYSFRASTVSESRSASELNILISDSGANIIILHTTAV